MIIPMKRVLLLCLEGTRRETLRHLRELGLVHITHIQAPGGKRLEAAQHELRRISRVLEVVPEQPGVHPSGTAVDSVVDNVTRIIGVRHTLHEELKTLQEERTRIEPLGQFDPAAFQQLRQQGLHIALFKAPVHQRLSPPAGAVIQELSRDRTTRYFAGVSSTPFQIEAEEIPCPVRSLREIESRIAEIQNELATLTASLAPYAGDRNAILEFQRKAEDEIALIEAHSGMGEAGPAWYMRGYCPAESIENLRSAAREHGWGLHIQEPRPSEKAPTLIRNPRWVEPIKVVFDFIGVTPGYREMDISAWFLLFFSLFFAMIVGDSGYGLIFLGLTLAGMKLAPKGPRLLYRLMLVMSVGTIIWGLLTGCFFGLSTLPPVLEAAKLPWLLDNSNIMFLCFLIGTIHLTLAHTWSALRIINSPQALAQVGWICTTWTMFFAAGAMVLNRPFPSWAMPMFIVGVVLITLFMTPWRQVKSEWFNHIMLPLNLVSNFVDVVSYVRLFAVGMATFAVANAFNGMGSELAAGGFIAKLGGALVIFVGHALNILLAIMGVMVHGVRLNTLEFSGHLGLQWSGIRFNPFVRKSTQYQSANAADAVKAST